MSRKENARIAADTLAVLQAGFYESPRDGSRVEIAADVAASVAANQLFTPADLAPARTARFAPSRTYETEILVAPAFTLEAARYAARAHAQDDHEPRVAVLNFASARNPGGGFLRGAMAQEESVARSSSLYLALTAPSSEPYYRSNAYEKTCVYTHHIIYTPRVVVFRNDAGHLLHRPYQVDVITAPAVNAGEALKRTSAATVESTMRERIRRVLAVARMQHVSVLVLGAFGCGVFRNEPRTVASMFGAFLSGEVSIHLSNRLISAAVAHSLPLPQYANVFKKVIFAIPSGRDNNLPSFAAVLRCQSAPLPDADSSDDDDDEQGHDTDDTQQQQEEQDGIATTTSTSE